MRSGVAVAAFVVLVAACGSPGPTATPIAATPIPVTPAPVTAPPTVMPTAAATVVATPTLQPTLGPTLPPPTSSSTVEIPPPIDEPTPTPTQAPTPTPTRPPTPAPINTPEPAGDAPVLEGACLTFADQPKGDFDHSLLVDLSFEEGGLDGVEIGISNTNGGQPSAGDSVLPGLWQVQLGVNGERLPQGTAFVLATAADAKGDHDLLPQVKEAIGKIPANFRPGQSVGNSCGGF